MRNTLAPLLILVASTSCSITFGGMTEKATREAELSFAPTAGAKVLEIDSYNGSITLAVSEAGAGISGTASVWAKGKTEEQALERLNQMELQFSQNGEKVLLVLTKPSGGSNNCGAQIKTLSVPADWAIVIDGSNGNVTVPTGFENIHIDTSNGNIDVAGSGRIFVDTSNGNVNYRGGSQDFELDSSNGSITVELKGDWSGRGMVSSSNGKITLRCNGVIDARLSTSTSNGKAHIFGPELDPDQGQGVLNLDTSNGNISVTHNFPE
ncbi:MAG: hypothetical protein ACPG31_00460 [Planctomycetota bacterium]